VLKGGQCNKDEYVKFSWNDIFYHFSSLLPVTRPGCWEENKFISFHERSPDNHTQFQTKMFKTYTRFQTKTAQKTIPIGAARTYIPDIGEYPRGCSPLSSGLSGPDSSPSLGHCVVL